MDSAHDDSLNGVELTQLRRSRQSLEFEQLWKRLPRQNLVPHRRDFNPAHASSLLRHFMLAEIHLGDNPSFPIRLVGSAVEERIQRDIKGSDYLEFLPQRYHASAVEGARLIVHHPCGLWQITPFHYQRGLAQNIEITVFPLKDEAASLMLGLLIPRDDLVRPLPLGDKAMLADTATQFQFLDVGAGAPEWPLR